MNSNTFRLMSMHAMFAVAVTAACAPPAVARDPSTRSARHSVENAVARDAALAVDTFHAALRRGDASAAASLLAPDALIFESGEAERSKVEYASHHLAADIEFSKSVPSVITGRSGHSVGPLAWVATESRTTGTYRGKHLDLISTETMILQRLNRRWSIVHVHWSSKVVKSPT